MKTLSINASDEEILDAVREWVELLEQEKYQEAYDYLYHPEDTEEHDWSPEDIEFVITGYDCEDPENNPNSRVTSWKTALKSDFTPRFEVDRWNKDEGDIWFDLPINGYWSDLTALLDFKVHNSSIVLILKDIHVM